MKFRIAILYLLASAVSARTLLMDSSGSLQLKIPTISTNQGVVSVVASPGTASFLTSSVDVLALESENLAYITCRGATLSGTSLAERNSLATTSIVSGTVIVDGITEGDIESGWSNSRHARTLTALFRARIALRPSTKQTLILVIKGTVTESVRTRLQSEVSSLFEATAVESDGSAVFDNMYVVKVVSVTSDAEAKEVFAEAQESAAVTGDSNSTLASALQEAHEQVRESGIASVALDPPHIAQAFLDIGGAYNKQARSARAKIASWRSRVSRGLVVDGFGTDAENLRKKCLGSFDSETLGAAGLPIVATYRLEMRTQLESLVESTIRQTFADQVTNLEKSILKKFRARLLQKLDVPAEDVPSENAAAMRSASFSFEAIMDGLEVPSLGLTKVSPCREMESLLTDEVMTFEDSPEANLKRTKQVTKTTSKEKKPGQRSVDFGLDLVAVLRPDGFGNLQGYAGYQLGGNSVTFGVHNDADDPQVITQFGGVRPPLLRVQPKLRVDVEL